MSRHKPKPNLQNIFDQAYEKGAPQERKVISYVNGTSQDVTNKILFRSIPVCFGIPMDEIMYSKFFVTFYKNMNVMPWDAMASTESTLVVAARNQIHKSYLTKSELPYLMMVDSDIMCPPNIVERLMAHNVGIVGGWYKNKHISMDHHPVVYDFTGKGKDGYLGWKHRDKPGTGLEKVDGMGAGCWLMRRDVAEKLGEKPYNNDECGEDLTLSYKLMELQIPLYVDWTLNCAHLGVNYT